MQIEITSSNYRDVAKSGYSNPECRTDAEFSEDLARVNHIVRSITRMDEKNFNVRLLLNQLITFFNVFNLQIGTALINHKLGSKMMQQRLSGVLLAMSRFNDQAHPHVDVETSNLVCKELGIEPKGLV